MTFAFFAGRSTLRRLHKTAQRNIKKQHRHESTAKKHRHESTAKKHRHESTAKKPEPPETNPNKSPKPELFSGSYWAWTEPIKIPFRGYSSMQARSPYLTQLESSLVIYFLGDLSAQMVQTEVFTTDRYEPIRGLRAMVIGGISSIPSYKWFLWLGRNFNYSKHWKSLSVKIVVNQTCFTPIFNTYFFGMQTLLSGGSFKEAKERVVKTVPVSWKNSWKLWPMVTAFTFTFIKPVNRNVFAGIVAIGWQTYLSWLNRSAEEERSKSEGKMTKRELNKAGRQAAKYEQGR